VRQASVAAQAGINTGTAIETLTDADKAQEPASGNASIASARQELLAILEELNSERYGIEMPAGTTAWPSLAVPTL
jgi:hypothetical protein